MLHAVNDLLFEDLAFFEYLFHGHAGNNDASLPFDDALDNVLNMIALRWHDCTSLLGRAGAVRIARQEERIFFQSIQIIVRTDGENGRQSELKLLHSHCLQIQGEIEWRDGDSCTFLPWFDKCLLDNPNILDPGAGDDKILVWLCNAIPDSASHCGKVEVKTFLKSVGCLSNVRQG